MRGILGLFGGMLMVAGMACALGALLIVTLGPPARWQDSLPAAMPPQIEQQLYRLAALAPRIEYRWSHARALTVPTADDGPDSRAESESSNDSLIPDWDEPPTSSADDSPTPGPPSPAATTATPARTPFRPITRIVLPSIPLNSEVTPAKLLMRNEGTTWDIPPYVAGHAETTAGAGEPGNAVLLGHVVSRDAGNVFSQLERARIGDLVRVFSGDDYFDYRVVDVRKVPRTNTSVLNPTETTSVSLITCAGAWLPLLGEYADRLVVRAELDGLAPAAAPTGNTPITKDASSRTILDESFADNRNAWPHDPAFTAAYYADGTYRLSARTPGRFVAIAAPIANVLHDVEVYGAFRKVGGPPGGGYGLIVRGQGSAPVDGLDQTGRYYVLEVGDRGQVGVWRRDEDHWVDLIPWTPSDAVRPGDAVNHLMVRTAGTQLTFIVNGVEVAHLDDAALPAVGGVGIFVGGDFNDVAVERFVVSE